MDKDELKKEIEKIDKNLKDELKKEIEKIDNRLANRFTTLWNDLSILVRSEVEIQIQRLDLKLRRVVRKNLDIEIKKNLIDSNLWEKSADLIKSEVNAKFMNFDNMNSILVAKFKQDLAEKFKQELVEKFKQELVEKFKQELVVEKFKQELVEKFKQELEGKFKQEMDDGLARLKSELGMEIKNESSNSNLLNKKKILVY